MREVVSKLRSNFVNYIIIKITKNIIYFETYIFQGR